MPLQKPGRGSRRARESEKEGKAPKEPSSRADVFIVTSTGVHTTVTAASTSAPRSAGLKRDASFVIPSMIPTQEVLQNLSRYHSNGNDLSEEQVERNEGDVAAATSDNSSAVLLSTTSASSAPLPAPAAAPRLRARPKHSPPGTSSNGPGHAVTSKARSIAEEDDLDPIMDFEDSDEDRSASRESEPIVSSLSSSLSSPQSRPQIGLSRVLGSPHSPSRRFVLPATTHPIRINAIAAPNSPGKLLRPVSAIPKPIVPTSALPQRTPGHRGAISKASPRKRQPVTTRAISTTVPQAGYGRAASAVPVTKPFNVIQPPPALGPQLLQVAEEARSEREQKRDDVVRKCRRQERGKEWADSHVDQCSTNLDRLPLSSLCGGLSSSPYVSSPELEQRAEPGPEARFSPKKDELKKQALLEEVVAMRKPQSPLSAPPQSSATSAALVRIKKEISTPVMYTPEEVSPLTAFFTEATNQVSVAFPAPTTREPQHSRLPSEDILVPPWPGVPLLDQSHEMDSDLPIAIPLPGAILQYASKLTPLDYIKSPPAKTGRFHVLALVLSIGGLEEIRTKKGKDVVKVELVVCDQSATSFKLSLWERCCKWVEMKLFCVGDVVLITEIRVTAYRQQTTRGSIEKITGNTSWCSSMTKLDGDMLATYQGNIVVESKLRILDGKRRSLALNLLDKDKGIARDDSLYVTQPLLSLPSQAGPVGGRQRPGEGNHGSELMTLHSTVSAVAPDTWANTSASSLSLLSKNSKAFLPILPPHITGTSIRASVVYRMLMVAGDESQGWEVGGVMSNGRLVQIQSQNTGPWIGNATPGRVLCFFGRFQQSSDIFHIDALSRPPQLLHDAPWATSLKSVTRKQFESICSLYEHRFMGNAVLDAYVLAVSFQGITSDSIDHDFFGFIQCHCPGCQSIAVAYSQTPDGLVCGECRLDPQKNRPLQWMYPAFELSIGDKPQITANLTSESLQLRCQLEIGDQVFLSIPAKQWMQDEKGFWSSKRRWQRLVGLMNSQGDSDDGGDRIKQRVRVEAQVGVNMVTKALKVDYI